MVTHSFAADEFRPAVVYQGPADDGAFNGTIHAGVVRYRKVTGGEVYEVTTPMDNIAYEKVLRDVVAKGYSPVIVPYGNHFTALPAVANEFPATRLIVFDVEHDLPNVYSFTFSEHEGSFLAGALAAMYSNSNTIGFIGGMNIPIIRRFACGYKQGARYVKPKIRILENFVGNTESAWDDAATAYRLTGEQISLGVDVVFQAAGASGLGAMRMADERGIYSIGVDQNQNSLFPGTVLTSMLKRVDKAVYAALMISRRGVWRDNVKRLGLSQDAVGLAFDEYNEKIITDEARKKIEEISGDILLGRIDVHDYLEGNYCPVW